MLKPRGWWGMTLGSGLLVTGGFLGWTAFDSGSHSHTPVEVTVKGEKVIAAPQSTSGASTTGAAAKPTPTPPSSVPPAPTAPARAVLDWVLGQLQATPPTGDQNSDKAIAGAIADLGQALAPGLWTDGNHIDAKKGNRVFDNSQQAIVDLLKIKTPPPPPSGPPAKPGKPAPAGLFAGYISDIDYATRLIGSTAIADNACSPAKSPALSAANKELTDGDSDYDKANFNGAVGHYRNAWQHALSAAGTSCSDGVTMPIAGAVNGIYPGHSTNLVLTLQNPNGFNASVTGLTVTVGDASSECAKGNLTIGAFSGPLTVPAGSSTTATIAVTLSSTAPNECQGAVFPLSYAAQAVQA